MLWSWRRAEIARDELKDWTQFLIDVVALRKSFALFQWNPCAWRSLNTAVLTQITLRTLVFAISALDLLVSFLLNLSFKNSRPRWLVKPGCF
jgi:hypothetical protein